MVEKIILFGSGNYAAQKMNFIRDNYEILGYVDNAVKPGKTEYEGEYTKLNPSDITFYDNDSKIILLSFKWYEMYSQLIEMGVDEKRILFGNTFKPSLDVVEKLLSDEDVALNSQNGSLVIEYNKQKVICANETEFKSFIRNIVSERDSFYKCLTDLPVKPFSKRFGIELGTAVDRIYIERFIESNSEYIKGTVMEIAELKYAQKYQNQIDQSLILHINGWGKNVIKGDFVTGEGIIENSVDCLICTQTLLCIYDIHSAIKNIYKMLKPGGCALFTVPGITQLSLYDYRNWGQYWSFTEQSARKMCMEAFDSDKISTKVYGNVKTAMSFLYGVCAESLSEIDFEYDDEQFQVIIGIRVVK